MAPLSSPKSTNTVAHDCPPCVLTGGSRAPNWPHIGAHGPQHVDTLLCALGPTLPWAKTWAMPAEETMKLQEKKESPSSLLPIPAFPTMGQFTVPWDPEAKRVDC